MEYNYIGWPIKKTERHTSWHNVDALTGISVWGNFSWEVWFCSFPRAHFVRQGRCPKYIGVNECHFGLPQLWALIHLQLCQWTLLWAGFWCKECALIKLSEIFEKKLLGEVKVIMLGITFTYCHLSFPNVCMQGLLDTLFIRHNSQLLVSSRVFFRKRNCNNLLV